MDLPAWLADAASPDPAAVAAAAALDGTAPHVVEAPRDVARALLASGGPVLLVDARGVRDVPDATLATGLAARAVPPGDMQAVRRRLAELRPARVALVDLAAPLAETVPSALVDLTPGVTWLTLVSESTGPTPEGPTGAALAALPRGLPALPGPPPADLVATDRGRLGLAHPADIDPVPPAAADVILRALEATLDLAVDAGLRGDETLADLLALEWLAARHPVADEAGRAAAAAVRLRASWGQPANAQAMLQQQRAREAGQSLVTRALLDQAEGDMLLGIGDPDGARPCHRRAARRLRRSGATPLLVRFTRRRAERLLSRGEAREAARLLRDVRAQARDAGSPAEVSATLRASADAARAAGELLGAEALYEEAATHAAPAEEAALRLVGEAALALALGDPQAARAALDRARPGPPLAQGAAASLRAECALRSGRPTEALLAARRAVDALGEAGDDTARGRALHLLAEALAASGQARAAAAAWLEALRVQVRIQDLVGLRRTLRAAADHEAESGDDGLAAKLRAALDALPGETLPYGIPDYGIQ